MDYRIPEIPMAYYQAVAARDGYMLPERPSDTKSSTAFRVSDSHTLTPRGEQAKFCVEHSLYAVYLSPSGSAAHNLLIRGKDGRDLLVSKSRWNQTKEIQEGSILYMADTVSGSVYKGKVIKRFSPYNVNDSFYSVRREVHKIMQKKKSKENHLKDVESEVELLFKVDWKKHATLDQKWRHKLDVSRRCTAFSLPVE